MGKKVVSTKTITEDQLTEIKQFQLYNRNDKRDNLFLVKLGIQKNTNLVILCTEIDSVEPDNLYQLISNINDLMNMNNIFKIYPTIEKAYNMLVKIFSHNNVLLEKDRQSGYYVNLHITILLPDGSNTSVDLRLKKKVEYIDIKSFNKLLEENKELRNQIEDLRSTIKDYEDLINMKQQPNNNVYNTVGNLNNNILDNNYNDLLLGSDNYNNSKETDCNLDLFNSKYKTNLLLSQEEIDLVEKNLDNEALSLLKNIKFKNIKYLWLNKNNIVNIEPLFYCNYRELLIFSASYNQIQSINNINQCFFINDLKELILSYNKIKNISSLAYCNFKQLTSLQLNNNNIKDIESIANCTFSKLTNLNLSNNEIENITPLAKCNLSQLEELILDHNKIQNINDFKDAKFKDLKKLTLNNNKLISIEGFKESKIDKLNELILNDNLIEDISPICSLTLGQVNVLYLHNNKINNISCLKDPDFSKLKVLYLQNNKFDKDTMENKKSIDIIKENPNIVDLRI